MKKKRKIGVEKSARKDITIGGFTRKELEEIRVKAARGLFKEEGGFENLVVLVRAVRSMEEHLGVLERMESMRERSIREREARKSGRGKVRK